MKLNIVICDKCGHVFKWGEHIHTFVPDEPVDMPASVVQHICDKCADAWNKAAKSRRDAKQHIKNTAIELLRRACDGLEHIYECEGIDYGTGDTYDEARKFLAEQQKGEQTDED